VLLDRLRGASDKSFAGRAGIIFFGTVVGQGLAFVLLPLTTRIYGAGSLGSAATVLAFLGIASLFTCLQYDSAMIVARDGDVPYLLLLSSVMAVCWTAILGCVILIPLTAHWRHLLASLGLDWTLLPLILFYSHFTLLTNYRLRKNEVYKMSYGRIIYYGGSSVLQVAGGLALGGHALVFLFAQTAGAFASTLYLMPWRKLWSWSTGKRMDIKSVSREMMRVARIYVNFPRFQMPGGVLNAVSLHMPILFMRIVFSEAWAGWYFVAWRILAAPTVLISQAIGQVFYRDSAERERNGVSQGQVLERIVFNLLRVSFLPALALAVAAPFFVRILLGEGWGPVGTILGILVVSMQVMFFTSPVSTFLNVKGMQAGFFGFCAAMLLARAIALSVGWWLHSEIGSVTAYTIASVVVSIPFLWYIVRSAEGSVWRIIRRSLRLFGDGAIAIAAIGCLWKMDILYKPQGIIVVAGLLGVAGFREIRRISLDRRGATTRGW
jgi:O-antigen/teichoic acid export membrane protein